MANIQLKVTGMKCGGCENQVRDALMACNGVSQVTASHQTASVEVEYDPAMTDLEAIRQVILNKGYKIEN